MTTAAATAIEHELKTWPESYEAVRDGRKLFEWRRDDRAFQRNDTLLLREWDELGKRYTGRSLRCCVTYILRGPFFQVPQGYAVLSIADVKEVRRG